MEFTEAEKQIVRRALWMYSNSCDNRANEIAQDKSGRCKPEWVGMAQDEARGADALIRRFAE